VHVLISFITRWWRLSVLFHKVCYLFPHDFRFVHARNLKLPKKDIVTLLGKLGYHQTKALEINHLVVLANVDASIDSNAKR